MKILFMGTPDFAATCLQELVFSSHEIVGAVCQPDKPVGRKKVLTFPPVKATALEHNIKVFQPSSLKNSVGLEILKQTQPDLVVVVAYGKILPADFLQFPKFGCINVHASLLPLYRGASPIHWSVINGDDETGVTIMQMDKGLDTGDILLQRKVKIDIDDTTEDMYLKMAPVAAKAMIDAIEDIQNGNIDPIKQNDALATKVGLLSRDSGIIDWNNSALSIHNLIRGLYSWPCTTTKLNGKQIKIYKSKLVDKTTNAQAGEIVESCKRLVVCCGDGKLLEILELQLEGKKRMTAASLLNGFKIQKGEILS